ncbi:mitochondrial protein [Arthroderma uncinatum]|uniref:mitochondrial protein n=1 Tax=Arthroderma uncinatum TaxID=74035 RepID=UPI00144AEF99|nr:mitochondrial protein [Arthroderma uncinatum]KAF3483623.1 mitochondrial protein [Arthroderma uncinatum]
MGSRVFKVRLSPQTRHPALCFRHNGLTDVQQHSRHGEPAWDTVSPSGQAPRWAQKVEWAKADLLDPSSYGQHLKNASAVVHSMGILLEADYKGILQGKESPITGLQKVVGSFAGVTGSNKGQMTYRMMNTESAISLAKKTSEENISTFVYISASSGAPVIPQGYIASKREAESSILSMFPELRSIFVRPTFMYDSSRKLSLPIALGGMIASEINLLTGGKLSVLGSMAEKPLKVSVVGEAVVESIDDGEVNGVVSPRKIEDLATKGWRKTML